MRKGSAASISRRAAVSSRKRAIEILSMGVRSESAEGCGHCASMQQVGVGLKQASGAGSQSARMGPRLRGSVTDSFDLSPD